MVYKWLITAAMVLLLGSIAAEAQAADITVNAPAQVVQGQEFVVSVEIANIANLYAASLDFTFDPEQWLVNAITGGIVIPQDDADPSAAGNQTLADMGIDNWVIRDNTDGTITYSQWQSRLGNVPGVNTGGTLFNLQLVALQDGQMNLGFGNRENNQPGIITLVNDGSGNADEVPSEIPFTIAADGSLTLDVQPATGNDTQVDIVNAPAVDKVADLATTRPLHLTALAGEEVTWTVTITKGAFGGWPGMVTSREFNSIDQLDGTWALDVAWPMVDNTILPNGEYQITVSAHDLAGNVKNDFEPIAVTVYNMPIKIISVATLDSSGNPKSAFNPGEVVQFEIGIQNLDNRDFRKVSVDQDERPLAIIKVERVAGSPEMLGTNQSTLLANDESWMTVGNTLSANAVPGTYTVTAYVWKGWGQEAMSVKDSSVTFTVN